MKIRNYFPEMDAQGNKRQCKMCYKKFKSKSRLTEHVKLHTDPKPKICRECGKQIAYGETLESHKRLHIGEKPNQCGKCSKRFRFKKDLTKHVEKCHPGSWSQLCEKERHKSSLFWNRCFGNWWNFVCFFLTKNKK